MTLEQILRDEHATTSTLHFIKARNWLNYATEKQTAAAIQYAAIELRYGIEYLLHELLVVNGLLTDADYAACLVDAKSMKKMLGKKGANYEKLADFYDVLASVDSNFPPMHKWDVGRLFVNWGIASEFLHFMGTHSRTYCDPTWIPRSLERLGGAIEEIWKPITTAFGFGVMRPSGMAPLVHDAWVEFSADKLSRDDLATRLKFLI